MVQMPPVAQPCWGARLQKWLPKRPVRTARAREVGSGHRRAVDNFLFCSLCARERRSRQCFAFSDIPLSIVSRYGATYGG